MANSAYSFAGISGFSGFSGISGTNQTLVTFTAANTFTAGQAIYRASGSFALAQANSINTSDILGVVQSATSTQFTIVANGYITGLTGLVDGSQYYLSDITPGLITTTVPTAAGSVIKPILIAIGTTAGIVVEYPGALIGNTNTGTSGYHAKWTGTTTIGNSLVTDDNVSVVTVNNTLSTVNVSAANLYVTNLTVPGPSKIQQVYELMSIQPVNTFGTVNVVPLYEKPVVCDNAPPAPATTTLPELKLLALILTDSINVGALIVFAVNVSAAKVKPVLPCNLPPVPANTTSSPIKVVTLTLAP